MTNELQKYYNELCSIFNMDFRSLPLASFRDGVDPRRVLTPPDDEGLVAWKIVKQSHNHDWPSLEHQLGFPLTSDLKDYYSSYLFLQLSGRIDKILLYFEPIYNEKSITDLIRRQFFDGQYAFPQTQIFLIGAAIVDGNDSYSIYFDNTKNKLFLFDPDSKQYALSDFSLQYIIGAMEPII